MAMTTDAILAVWNDVDGALEAAFNDWYVRDHLPDRLAIPGFRRGRRWLSTGGSPRYFTYYEIDDVGVMHSPAYLDRHGNPTEWTRQIMPAFVGMNRSICRVTARRGSGDGGVAGVLRLAPDPQQAGTLRRWLAAEALPAIADLPGVVAAALWELDADASRMPDTAETRLRTAADATIDWAVVVEATRIEEAARIAEILNPDRAAAAGAEQAGPLETYRLLCSLSRGADGR
jgi:hypothetical protein